MHGRLVPDHQDQFPRTTAGEAWHDGETDAALREPACWAIATETPGGLYERCRPSPCTIERHAAGPTEGPEYNPA